METVKAPVCDCGVSWTWLLTFVEKYNDMLTSFTAKDVVKKIIIPETSFAKVRYVDILPATVVSTPTYFASHVWSEPFLDLVDSLKYFIEGNNNKGKKEEVFVWIDIFAVNQHAGSTYQSEDLNDLPSALQRSQQTLVCVDRTGKLLTRIWCLFEIWHTFLMEINRLKIIAIKTDFDKLKEIFIHCDVQKAQATVLADRDRILREIEQKTPYSTMNENIKIAIVDSTLLDARLAETFAHDDPTRAAFSFDTCARMLKFVARYSEALPLFQRSLELREKALGPEHPETASSLNNLGLLLKNMGKYDEALPFYQRALAIREKVLGPEHPETASSITNIGRALHHMRRFSEALPMYQQALTINEKVLGPEHPDTAAELRNIARLLQMTGKYSEALPFYQRALAIREKVNGPEHPKTAVDLNDLGSLLQPLGNYSEALPIILRSLAIREKVLGPEHPATAVSLHNLATCYHGMGNRDEALSRMQRAIDVREKALGPQHPFTVDARGVLENMKKDM